MEYIIGTLYSILDEIISNLDVLFHAVFLGFIFAIFVCLVSTFLLPHRPAFFLRDSFAFFHRLFLALPHGLLNPPDLLDFFALGLRQLLASLRKVSPNFVIVTLNISGNFLI
jgi:hypothetical protein